MEYSNFQALKAQSTRGVDYATALGATTTDALSSLSSAADMLKDAGSTADNKLTNAIKLAGIESSAAVQKIQNHISNLETHKEAFKTGTELAGGVELGIKAAQKVVSKAAEGAAELAAKASEAAGTEMETFSSFGAAESTGASEVGAEAAFDVTEGVGASVAEGAAEGVAAGVGESAAAVGFAAAESVAAASVVLEPLAIAGGAVMLGLSIADAVKSSKREKKEAKEEKKETKVSEAQSTSADVSEKRSAEKSYDAQVAAIKAKTDILRTGILSNAHLSVTGGHQSLRNRN
jgi:exonuclease VII small subunit